MQGLELAKRYYEEVGRQTAAPREKHPMRDRRRGQMGKLRMQSLDARRTVGRRMRSSFP